MMLIVNTTEFEEAVKKETFNKIRPFNTGEYPGGKYNITDLRQVLDRRRVVETIQKANYTVRYGKIVLMNNEFWGQDLPTETFIDALFHEYIHNLGYSHDKSQPGGTELLI